MISVKPLFFAPHQYYPYKHIVANIVKTADRFPYCEKIYALLGKHFDEPDFTYDYNLYAAWQQSPFHIINFGMDGDEIKSYGAFIITNETSSMALIEGRIQEHEVAPYVTGRNESAWLFWLVLIFEDRKHSPYLIRSLFKETEARCREWKINISHVYAIAYTKLSERIMKKYRFTKVGVYQGKYPIMLAKVSENPYMQALIPNIDCSTRQPW